MIANACRFAAEILGNSRRACVVAGDILFRAVFMRQVRRLVRARIDEIMP
jgi:hypothetical protein